MQGFQAVEYAYGEEGTWKRQVHVKYEQLRYYSISIYMYIVPANDNELD